MTVSQRDRNRIDAITAQIKPRYSLLSRLDLLTEHGRDHFNQWRRYCDDFLHHHEDEAPGDAYRMHLDSYGPFGRLSAEISVALFGPVPSIQSSASEEEACLIWQRYSERDC